MCSGFLRKIGFSLGPNAVSEDQSSAEPFVPLDCYLINIVSSRVP